MRYSVIVPIYKVEEYLVKCIVSILNQSFKDFELILVDDGSPDNCPAICDRYKEKDERVKVIHKENGGLVNARNTGLKAASGDYICYIDGDDWVENDLLQTIEEKALNPYSPDLVVFGAKRCFQDKEVIIPAGLREGLYSHNTLETELFPYMMYDNRRPFCSGLIFPVAWNKIYKREFLLQHYCKEEKIRMGEDNAFIFECLYFAKNVYFCERILYCYNQMNSGSMVHSYDKTRFQNNKLLTDYIESNLGGINEVLDKQINAFKAYWLIMAVFHEIKSGIPVGQAAKHIKRELKSTKCLEAIELATLPTMPQIVLLMLKCRQYFLTMIAVKIVNSKREKYEA